MPQNIPYDVEGVTPDSLPRSSANPYRKRPVKLQYDKNDFHMFRLPSEKAFLLSSFDSEDLFGKRKGVTHSSHIQAQVHLDSNLVWLFCSTTVVLLLLEVRRTHTMLTLRENYFNSDMGFFKEEDFN